MKTPGNEQSTKGVMMSGESPLPHGDFIFELKESSISSPVNAKCLLDKAVQISPDLLEETSLTSHHVVAIQELNHTPPVQNCPTTNRKSLVNEEDIEKVEEAGPSSSQAQTISLDMLDGDISCKTNKTNEKFPSEEEPRPDDSCGIQCLYFTIQCCECTIL